MACNNNAAAVPQQFPALPLPPVHIPQRQLRAQPQHSVWEAKPRPVQMGADGIALLCKRSTRTPPMDFTPTFKKLGAGGFGVVYGARLAPMYTVARKISNHSRSLQLEHDLLLQLRASPYIVRAEEFEVRGQYAQLDTELCAGDLCSALTETVRGQPLVPLHVFTEVDCDRILYEIASALQFVAEKGWLHNDIKPDNILLSANYTAKLADFGVSVRLGAQLGHKVGTYDYNPPECTLITVADSRKDIWAYALIALMFVTRAALPGKGSRSVVEAAQYASGFLNDAWRNRQKFPLRGSLTPTLTGVLDNCFLPFDVRPTPQHILQHAFTQRYSHSESPLKKLADAAGNIVQARQREAGLQQTLGDLQAHNALLVAQRATAEQASQRNSTLATTLRGERDQASEAANRLQAELDQHNANARRLQLELDTMRAREHAAIDALQLERTRYADERQQLQRAAVRPAHVEAETAMSVHVCIQYFAHFHIPRTILRYFFDIK